MSGRMAIGMTGGLIVLLWAGMARAQDAQPESTPAPEAAEAPAPAASEPVKEADLAPEELSAEDILREFQRERPTAEPLLPQETVESAVPANGAAGGGMRGPALRLPDGFFLVDRLGRVVQDGDWWTIAFAGDNNPDASPDPPMKLLPNQMLERAVREVQGGAPGVQFVVSGEVTDFMGENYLLLRKLMRKRDLGNLSK